MNETTLAALSGINYELLQHLKWLLERKDLDALSRVIPIVDRFTKLLIDIGETGPGLKVSWQSTMRSD
jgi:hypothetical protein